MKAVFLHIQKTAGTSIVNTARLHFGNDQVLSHGDVWTTDPAEVKAKHFISSHLGFHYAKAFLRAALATDEG